MRHTHDGPIWDDSGRRGEWTTGKDPDIWYCDTCGTKNNRHGDDCPTCAYCGRFRDQDYNIEYGWGDL